MNNPRLYTIGSSLQIRDAKEILEQHMHKLSWGYGEKVLDIGCGPGTVTTSILQPLLPADATLVGCDLSEKMVAFASAMYGNETIKFRQMDVSKPNIWDEWEKEEFDKVFSFYCLNWIHNQRQAALNIFNLLKDDGWAFVTITGYAQPFASFEKLAELPQWMEYMKNYKKYISPYHYLNDPAKECSHIMESVGFEVITCINKNSTFEFSHIDALIDIMKPITVISNWIPEHLHDKYFEDMKQVMIDNGLVQKGDGTKVSINYNVLIVVVHKPKK